MRKVIGIGETILDIIFRNGQPTAAVPGGSVFNGVVSLARAGVPVNETKMRIMSINEEKRNTLE